MKTFLKKSITFKDGSVWTDGTQVHVCVEHDRPMIAYRSQVEFPLEVKKVHSVNLYKWFDEFEQYSMSDIEEAVMDGRCPSLTGQDVEPDGWDSEDFPSLLLAAGMC